MKILSNHEYALLNREIDYWRQAWERERERADRAVDLVLESNGRVPVSEPVRAEHVEKRKRVEKLQHDMQELYLDDAPVDESSVETSAVDDLRDAVVDLAARAGTEL